MIKFVNRAKMTTATTGTASSIVLGSAVDGFQTLAAAGVNNGDVVHFVINDGQNWELAEGTFASATNTLTRTTLESNNEGAPINLSGAAMVAVTALASDLVQPADLSTVATTGAYADLSGKPALGTAAATNSTAYATAAQGTKADSALQPGNIGSTVQGYNANIVIDGSYVHTDNNYTTAEKSKLAGIEAGATADQTAAEILTAIKTVDGAASGLDADLLDGNHATAFATAAQGALADTATQPGDNISTLTNDAGYTTNVGDITGVTAGSGLTGGGTSGSVTVSHADTSTQASVDNAGGTVIQDVTLDGFGHVTGLASKTLTATDVGAATASHTHTISNVTGLQTALDNKLDDTQKGAANGLAELDATGKVPSAQLPSYVDDVLEYAAAANFPATGETGKLYVALDTNDVYRWSGSAYVKVSDAVTSADQATKLATARTISLSGDVSGSTSFDGSANVSITATVANNSHTHTSANITDLTEVVQDIIGADIIGGGAITVSYNDTTGDTTISHTDTSAQASVNNSGATFIQDVTLDTYGHVTGLGSVAVTPALIGASATSHNHTLDSLSNVTVTSNAAGEILQWNGSAWINNTLAEAGIQPAGSYLTTSTTFGGDVSGTYSNIVVADDSHNHVISNVDGLQTALDGKLNSTSYTASDVLTKIKTVDGSGSGLDADTLDGQHASAFLTGNQTITLSGDLTGSGTTSINAQLAANVVGASELNVSGNGTTAQYLRSDGDGSFTWATPTDTNTTYTAGSGLTLAGTVFSHTDTSSQASVNNSGATVIQDVTLDTYGHVTGLASKKLTASTVGALSTAGGTVSGTVTATAFVGDGSGLTNLPASGATRTVFDVSGTWTKPAGLDDNAFVTVELWGGGGGGASGGRNGGGGGGGYNRRVFRAGDLPSSLAVTVGAGGGLKVAGGTSFFGTYAYAYGGGYGYYSGGGGGSFGSVGQNGQSSGMQVVYGGGSFTPNAHYQDADKSGGWLGGAGYPESTTIYSYAVPSIFGGGGGGHYMRIGGNSVYGGGGGSGRSYSASGGTSVYGGNGGAYAQAGTAPGGGGGAAGVGATGRVVVYC